MVQGDDRHRRRRGGWRGAALLATALVLGACGGTAEAHSGHTAGSTAYQGWLTFAGDPAHQDVDAAEKAITASSVRRLHRLWSVKLLDLADERPVLAPGLLMPDGRVHDVLYLTTDKGTLLALDAATGGEFWDVTPRSSNPKYTKSSPAVEPATGLVYSYGLDGRVHRFTATTGQEVLGSGWPVLVTKMPLSEKVSSPLNLYRGYLYVTTASFSGDAPPYQGHVVAIDVRTGVSHVFNSLCNDHAHVMALNECRFNGGGIWARPGVTPDPVTHNIFFTISDGFFTIPQHGHEWGDSIVEMTPDGTRVVDSYTPSNYLTEAFQNRDLGSTAPALLPTLPASRTPYLAVQAGKEGLLRLVDRQDLSGKGGPAHVGGELQTVLLPDLCPTLAQPVAWQDPAGGVWLFVSTLCHMDAYRVVTSPAGVTRLQAAWYRGVETTTSVVAGGVLFAASSGDLLALDARTGRELWHSAAPSAGGSIGQVHWESPLVIGGRVYCTDETDHLIAYGI